MMTIRPATSAQDLTAVRALFREYHDAIAVDLSFQRFEAELAELPGAYAEPRGCLLVADAGGTFGGCGALRPVDAVTGEMKRLFVRPAYRSTGLGRQLAGAIIDAARCRGYERLVLDTLPTMGSAQRLYESLGFTDIGAYTHNPIAGTRFMALAL